MTPATVPGVLRPSSSERWGDPDGPCAGSFALEQHFPEDEDSPQAREGTAAHFYVTEAVQGRVHAVGTLAPNGHPIDAEMIDEGRSFIDRCAQAIAEHPAGSWRVEQHLTMHGLIHPDCEGTPDFYLLDLAAGFLTVKDYKYGHGYVEVRRNPQIAVNYVAGVCEAYELTEPEVRRLRIVIDVIQPRNYQADGPVRTWETTGDVIWPMIEAMSEAAYAAKVPGAPTRTGARCRYCPALTGCEAGLAVVDDVMESVGRSVPHELSPLAVGKHLRYLDRSSDRLKAMRDAREAQGLALARSPAGLPGWTIGFSSPRAVWDKPPEEVFAMCAAFGVDARPKGFGSAMTPAQALKAGVDASVIAAYSRKPPGAARLVPADINAAAKAFGG